MLTFKKRTMFSGVAFESRYGEIIVPSLTVRQTEELTGKIVEHDNMTPENYGSVAKRFKLRCEIVLPALQRNYPEATIEDLDELMTAENSDRMLMTATGLNRISAQVRDAGENQPVENASQPTQ